MLGKEFPSEVGDFYTFKPYSYGPFCVDIYNDADALEILGMIAVYNPGHTWARRYAATPAGVQRANEVRPEAPHRAVEYLRQVVNWASRLTFQELVSKIYEHYPEQRQNSVFRH